MSSLLSDLCLTTMHDIKDIRKNSEKYRESQRNRGENPKVIDDLLLIDAEHRALLTIGQELQSKLNKLTIQYGRAKHSDASPGELFLLEMDMENAKIDAGFAKTDVRLKYMEERQWEMLGGREFAEQIAAEIDESLENSAT